MTEHSVQKDKYNFVVGSLRNQIAVLIDQGLTNKEIVERNYLKQTVYSTRYAMKTSTDETKKRKQSTLARDQWGFRDTSKNHQAAVLLDKGKDIKFVAEKLGMILNTVHRVRAAGRVEVAR